MTRSEKIEITGVVAILVGLAFVGLELRQNSALLRITATQTLAAEYSDALEVMVYEGEAACIYSLGRIGLHNLNSVQRLRFFGQMFLIFRAAEQLHYYSLEGMVEDRIWRGFERQIREATRLPGIQEWWAVRHSFYSDAFQEYIGGVMETGPTQDPQDFTGESCLQQ